jgi:hypothetical protein
MPRHDPDQKTKQRILETASRLFAEKGLENVNVEDVVKEVGVTRGAFYHYFKSREELIVGVTCKDFNDNNPFALAYKEKGLNALEKLRFILKYFNRPSLDMSAGLRNEKQKLANNPVVFKSLMLFQVNVIAQHLEKLLIEGNEDGSISVKYPKQTAQVISLLSASWLKPYVFHTSYIEFTDKILFLEQLGEVLGVPFMDEEIKDILLELGKRDIEKQD